MNVRFSRLQMSTSKPIQSEGHRASQGVFLLPYFHDSCTFISVLTIVEQIRYDIRVVWKQNDACQQIEIGIDILS